MAPYIQGISFPAFPTTGLPIVQLSESFTAVIQVLAVNGSTLTFGSSPGGITCNGGNPLSVSESDTEVQVSCQAPSSEAGQYSLEATLTSPDGSTFTRPAIVYVGVSAMVVKGLGGALSLVLGVVVGCQVLQHQQTRNCNTAFTLRCGMSCGPNPCCQHLLPFVTCRQ